MSDDVEALVARLREMLAAVSSLPWGGCEDGSIEGRNGGGICHMVEHGNLNTFTRTGEHFSHAEMNLLVEAINALPTLLDHIKQQTAELERLRARVAELEEAGRPFADEAKLHEGDDPEEDGVIVGLDDCRRMAKALERRGE